MSEESTHPRSRGHSLNNTLSVSLLIFCARCLSMLPHASLASQMRHSDVTLVSVQTKRMADIVRYPSALRVERSDFGLPRSHDTSHPLLHLFPFPQLRCPPPSFSSPLPVQCFEALHFYPIRELPTPRPTLIVGFHRCYCIVLTHWSVCRSSDSLCLCNLMVPTPRQL